MKFVLTNENNEMIKQVYDIEVYRIKAVKDFVCMNRWVREGELGGFVQREDNLSQEDSCWIENDAVVMQSATVLDDAVVSEIILRL